MVNQRSHTFSLTIPTLFLLVSTALFAEPVVFTDIADDPGVGLDFQRVESPSESLFDLIKQQEFYTFADLLVSPLKGRGAPGVALFDLEGDGDLDIYVTNGPGAANSLFANQLTETGALTFVDVASSAGIAATDQDSTGVCVGDIDNDGDADVAVLGNLEPNRLFENQGDGTFLDISFSSGVDAASAPSASCSFGDVDGDGLLDLFVGNILDMTVQIGIFVEPFALNEPNQLLVNQGGNTFLDRSAVSGALDLDLPVAPPGAATISWAVALVDIDLDGDVDILQADDQAAFPRASQGGADRGYIQLLRNDGSGSFTAVTSQVGLDQAGAWMGLAFADFDHDGRLDVFGTNFGNHGSSLFSGSTDFSVSTADSRWFLQTADDDFEDSSTPDNRLHTPFGWGASAIDYDNDGHTDIVFHGGLDAGPFLVTNPGSLLRNDGAGGFHRDTAALAGSTDHNRRVVHGLAAGDLDNNGYPDIVTVSNHDTPPPTSLTPAPLLGGEFQDDAVIVESFVRVDPDSFLFTWSGLEFPDGSLSVEMNSGGNGNRWLQVETLGTVGLTTDGGVNRDGIGAVVRVNPIGGPPLLHPVLGGSSYASNDSKIVSVGLGHSRYATVDVLWPGGIVNRLYHVRAGTRLLFPEIPCQRGTQISELSEYLGCVHGSLSELGNAGILTPKERARFFFSALAFFFEGL